MIPEVGSKWKRRDGREYVVVQIVSDPAAGRPPHAVMKLHGEREKWRRSGVKVSLRRFHTYHRPADGSRAWSERRPDYAKRSRWTIAPSADYLERLRRALSYDPDTGELTWIVDRSRIKAGTRAGVLTPKGYYRLRFEGRDLLAQHVAWLFIHGVWPTLDLDHEDGVRTNNLPSNLREATNQQNQRNRKPTSGAASPYKGVSRRKGAWVAMIERQYLGSFQTAEDAARAYDRAALARDPVFARTNFPRSDYDQAA